MTSVIEDRLDHLIDAPFGERVGANAAGERKKRPSQPASNDNPSFTSERRARPRQRLAERLADSVVHHQRRFGDELRRLLRAQCRSRAKLSQSGSHLVPNRRPQPRPVQIGFVVPPIDARAAADSLGVGPLHTQHRPNKRHANVAVSHLGAHRPALSDTSKPLDAGASQKRHQHRFELVVAVVRRCHKSAFALPRQLSQRRKSNPASLRLDVAPPNPNRSLNKRRPQSIGQRPGRISVGARLSHRPHVMQNMSHDDPVRHS